jgi:hypothetical protein
MTVRLAVFKIPLRDTLSDPFRFEFEVLLEVVFAVLFTPGSGVVAVGIILIVVVAFTVFFVVVEMQPVATINPTAIHRVKGIISFIGFVTRPMFVVNISILLGTGAMQPGSDAEENLDEDFCLYPYSDDCVEGKASRSSPKIV